MFCLDANEVVQYHEEEEFYDEEGSGEEAKEGSSEEDEEGYSEEDEEQHIDNAQESTEIASKGVKDMGHVNFRKLTVNDVIKLDIPLPRLLGLFLVLHMVC